MKVNWQVRVDAELVERVRQAATAAGEPMSALVARALEREMARLNKREEKR